MNLWPIFFTPITLWKKYSSVMGEQVFPLHSLYTSTVFKELHFAKVEFFFLGVPHLGGHAH